MKEQERDLVVARPRGIAAGVVVGLRAAVSRHPPGARY